MNSFQVDSGISRGCLDPPYLPSDAPHDDEDDRPLRTSSLGSKPDISRRKNRWVVFFSFVSD